MRRIASLKLEYKHADSMDSQSRLNKFYEWLINKAIDNLVAKKHNAIEIRKIIPKEDLIEKDIPSINKKHTYNEL